MSDLAPKPIGPEAAIALAPPRGPDGLSQRRDFSVPTLDLALLLARLLGLGADHCFPILNILVPQSAQVPSVAGLPFFIVTSVAFFISFLALHFMQ